MVSCVRRVESERRVKVVCVMGVRVRLVEVGSD